MPSSRQLRTGDKVWTVNIGSSVYSARSADPSKTSGMLCRREIQFTEPVARTRATKAQTMITFTDGKIITAPTTAEWVMG